MASRGRALGSSALHLAVVIFFSDLPLVSSGAMAVRVQLDLPLGSALAAGVAGVFVQVVVVVLIVVGLLERSQSFHISRHLETRNSGCLSSQSGLGASKQMMSLFVYIRKVT